MTTMTGRWRRRFEDLNIIRWHCDMRLAIVVVVVVVVLAGCNGRVCVLWLVRRVMVQVRFESNSKMENVFRFRHSMLFFSSLRNSMALATNTTQHKTTKIECQSFKQWQTPMDECVLTTNMLKNVWFIFYFGKNLRKWKFNRPNLNAFFFLFFAAWVDSRLFLA